MCGFAGFLSTNSSKEDVLFKMGNSISHRGPDGQGTWLEEQSGIGLAHRRLSILDLSPAGHQPMHSGSGRYCISFNGEIYNHLELRKELEGVDWRGHSDTETLLAGFDRFGVQEMVNKSIGMFGFAAWDKKNRELILARDRIGEKPVYYGWQGSGANAAFIFGSELGALREHPSFDNEISRGALSLYLRHNCVPSPYSIYRGISKLSPGCILTVSLKNKTPNVINYWSAISVIESGAENHRTEDSKELVDELEDLLKKVIRGQMISDVPLGAFLSGGLDSSTVVSLMQAQSSNPIKTFTVGFEEKGYNEAVHAKVVATHLGTDHTELYVTPEESLAIIPKLASIYDEPFSDSSQIPTYLISQLARRHVTVSLSGDGADELFCGYNRYLFTEKVWSWISVLPLALRKLASFVINSLPIKLWDFGLSNVGLFLPRSLRQSNYGDKLLKGAGVIDARSADDLYLKMVSHENVPSSVVLGDSAEPGTLLTSNSPKLESLNRVQQMMALDLITYLPDDILTKVDRAAMAVSLETRVPFLDHRLAEFAWKLPMSMKIRNGQSKWIMREVLHKYVPKELIERPKMGFGVPLGSWLRGNLRDWAESLLDESRLRNEGFFNPKPIRQKWAEHLSGKRNWQYQIWDALMFQAWLEKHH
jgi:asparagine synthase (glutamine-hydrolysing)